MQQWLVKTGLIFFRNYKNVEILVKLCLCLCFSDMTSVLAYIKFRLGIFFAAVLYGARKSYQNAYIVIAFFLYVSLALVIIAYSRKT